MSAGGAGSGRVGLVDSGATHTLVGFSGWFRGLVRSTKVPVSGVAGCRGGLVATGVGRVEVPAPGGVRVTVERAFYVPGLGKRALVSVSQIVEEGWSVLISKVTGTNQMTVWRGEDRFVVPVRDNLYAWIEGEGELDEGNYHDARVFDEGEVDWGCSNDTTPVGMVCTVTKGLKANTYVGQMTTTELLHRRCGHISYGNQRWARRVQAVFGASVGRGHVMAACDACVKAKMKRTINKGKPTRPARRPLERVHFDFNIRHHPGGRGWWGAPVSYDFG